MSRIASTNIIRSGFSCNDNEPNATDNYYQYPMGLHVFIPHSCSISLDIPVWKIKWVKWIWFKSVLCIQWYIVRNIHFHTMYAFRIPFNIRWRLFYKRFVFLSSNSCVVTRMHISNTAMQIQYADMWPRERERERTSRLMWFLFTHSFLIYWKVYKDCITYKQIIHSKKCIAYNLNCICQKMKTNGT